MKTNPLVSIVVCTHNRAKFLNSTMDTVFAQQYRPVEILVVDDGSTDNTPELVASYGDRVRYYRHENKGIAATRTTACKLAQGEYIAFQDDDDLMPPDRITCLYETLRQYPIAVYAVGDWEVIDAQGNPTGMRQKVNIEVPSEDPILLEDGYFATLWPFVNPIPHNTLFRRADGNRVGWFDEVRFSHGCSDTDFYARLGKLGPIVYVPKVVSYYRMGHAQLWDNQLLGEYSFFLLIEKHLKSMNSGHRELRERLEERMLSTLSRIAFLRYAGKDIPDRAPKDYLARGLSLLDVSGRLKYRWYSSVRLPLRRLIKGDARLDKSSD